jgi:hypothetical protein
MTITPKAGDPVEVVPAVVDAGAVQQTHDLQTKGLAAGNAPVSPTSTQAAVAPTQLRRPWRSTARTIFQATVSLAAMWGLIVVTLDLPDWAWVGTSVAVAGGITRVMAIPAVETWLRQFLPFLAAAPAPSTQNKEI